MSKFKISKGALTGAMAIVTAIVAGVSAFTSEIDKHKMEKTVSELVDKVSKLENK